MNKIIDFLLGEKYMSTFECIQHDWLLALLIIILNLAVIVGYFIIAYYWYLSKKKTPNCKPRRALGSMVFIFVLCGLCGYGFQIIRLFYPIWHLYCIMMSVLIYFIYRYIFDVNKMTVVYNEMSRDANTRDRIGKIIEGASPHDCEMQRIIDKIEAVLNETHISVDGLKSKTGKNIEKT